MADISVNAQRILLNVTTIGHQQKKDTGQRFERNYTADFDSHPICTVKLSQMAAQILECDQHIWTMNCTRAISLVVSFG